jgi:hypothetical protein
MTEKESEKKATETPEVKHEAHSIGGTPKVKAMKPLVFKTHIAARLDEAIKCSNLIQGLGSSKPLYRNSELVPLSLEFDQMRKRLRSLIAATKQYHTARAQVEKARMEVRFVLEPHSDFPFPSTIDDSQLCFLSIYALAQRSPYSCQRSLRTLLFMSTLATHY